MSPTSKPTASSRPMISVNARTLSCGAMTNALIC